VTVISLPPKGKVLTINVTHAVLSGEWTGSVGSTGIDKRPVLGRVRVAENHVAGDRIHDSKNHGGYNAAVYAYAREDADWWEKRLGTEIANGRFGENLTTSGVDVTNAVIGEQWRIGSTVLEISQPRIPCRVFAGFWDRPTLIKEFIEAGRPGAYLRILEEGDIGAGDDIEIIFRPPHNITIHDLYAAKSGERSRMEQILAVPELSDSYRDWARQIIESNKS
jgi:MOSC domain-containing protein YiiM